MNRDLFPHQIRAMDLLRQSLAAGRRRPMLQAPTGFGKTMLAAAVVDGATSKGNRVVFTVPALSLIDQTVEMFWNEGIRDVGVIQGRHEMTNGSRPVQIASVQTLMKRPLPDCEVVVLDEAHRWFKFYETWLGSPDWQQIPFIGLSATPWTKGLGKYFDDLIIAATTAELIEAGFLSKFRVFAPSHPDLSKVRTVAGDYHEGDLSGVMDEGTLTADVVDTWKRIGGDRPTLCFAVDRAHAQHLRDRFESAHVSTGYIDATTPAEERAEIRKKFHDGSIRVVCNVGCLTTGVDWDVRCIVLARPTKSEMLFVQMIGRGLRTADGKDDCLILDHSDSHLRLGFVTDIHHERLNNGEPKAAKANDKKPALPKECPQCSFLKPARLHKCPSCGFEPQRQTGIKPQDGELAELNMRGIHSMKQLWYSMLIGYARDRGKSDKWVLANYRQKFGVWPRGLSEVAVEPDQAVRGWIRSRQIAWAKRKQAAA